MLLGESGVGKTSLARRVHHVSPRAEGPFVEVSCGAIPATLFESEMFGCVAGAFTGAPADGRPGYLEQADGGTLFLDEVAELPLALQPKLLSVLQSGEFSRLGDDRVRRVDIRLVAATNRDLAASVERGSFRADLFYRLNVVPITVPPLRERRAEIPHLVETIMRRLADRHGEPPLLHDRHWGYLMSHDWPGNIRELENHLERLWFVVPEDQPTESTAQAGRSPTSENREAPLANALAATEYRCLEQALRQCSTTYEIARYLGISQPTVVRKLRHHGLRATGRGSGKTAARRERRKAIKKAPVV